MMTREAFKEVVFEKSRQIEEWDHQTRKKRHARWAAALLLFFFLFIPALLCPKISDLPTHSAPPVEDSITNSESSTDNVWGYGSCIIDAGCDDSIEAIVSLLTGQSLLAHFRTALLPEDAASGLLNKMEKESLGSDRGSNLDSDRGSDLGPEEKKKES